VIGASNSGHRVGLRISVGGTPSRGGHDFGTFNIKSKN
jgi:hypothetical protein